MSHSSTSGSGSLERPSDASPPEETANHPMEFPVTREQLNHYRNVAENVQSELAATLVKFECAQSELRDLRSKLLSKEVCYQELKAEVESYKESSARKSSLLVSLRGRVQELQEESAALSASKIRAETSAHTMMKENQEVTRKALELDEKLQNCMKENEESKKQGLENLRRHEEFRTELCDCLSLDKKQEEASDEDLILKLRELCKENTFLKGQIVTLEETINVHEMEAKANRETISRLAAEVSREQRRAASWAVEKDKLSQDLLGAVDARTALEKEAKLFQERLLAAQRAWDASKQELNQLRKNYQQLDLSLKAGRDAAAAFQSQNSSFREKLAKLLCSGLDAAGPTEDVILERIRDLGIQEESKTRLKTQKERLESKEVHMSLLRQKIAQLQQETQARTGLAVERDEAHLTIRKLEKRVERLQKELSACREHNTELKAQLADTNELKIKTLEQAKAIEDLTKSRDNLEKLKEKAEKKIVLLKSELETTEEEAKADQGRTRAMIELAASELTTLKKYLEESERREQQLVDFREVISQMLGLNLTSLALPDYEIIKCLESLVHSHHHHFVACECLKDTAAEHGSCPQCHLELQH
ncbi:coiled-coil domain-containing protein 170 isoform X4 [Mesocricetus auratus]|uniref:Coiled-coil domain-containing protein 170 isoform X4 n=1 Tax=Mesocricetus auratus TaxID=10036 RepID=A0A1U8D3N5_MESAU|nr:coiled-coil domain-containing protein 170 isoform X4 [Mesocricetus auratus]